MNITPNTAAPTAPVVLCPITGKAPLPSPAPMEGTPGAAFFKANGEVGFYEVTGKRRGAAGGERGPRVKENYQIRKGDISFTDSPLEAVPFSVKNEKGEETNTAEIKAAQIRNARRMLSFFLPAMSFEHGGSDEREETVELDSDEIFAAAKKSGIKANDVKGMLAFAMKKENSTKTVKVPAVPAEKFFFAEFFQKNPDAVAEVSPEWRRKAMTLIETRFGDAFRLVLPDGE